MASDPVLPLPLPRGAEGRREGVPSPSTRITAELWWGDTRQQASSFERPFTARDFPLWGFAVPEDFVLASPTSTGSFVVHAPGDSQPLTLEPGSTKTFTAGAMRLTLRVDAVLPPLPRAKVDAWPVTILSAAMMVALFTAMFLAPEPEEQPFTPKTALHYITLIPPTTPPKVVKPDETKSSNADPSTPTKTPPRPRPPRSPPPSGIAKPPVLDRLAKLNELLADKSLKNTLASLKKATPGKGRSMLASLGPIGRGGGLELIDPCNPKCPPGVLTIGAKGIKGGMMSDKGYGIGRVLGRVDRPSSSNFSFRPGQTTSIDKDALAKVIQAHLGEVSSCYESALMRNGGGGGRLVLEWVVSTAGHVDGAKVKRSSLKDGSIASCIVTFRSSRCARCWMSAAAIRRPCCGRSPPRSFRARESTCVCATGTGSRVVPGGYMGGRGSLEGGTTPLRRM